MGGGVSYIYFITREPGDKVKIGFTKSNPEARRATLQTGCPDPLDLAVYFPGTIEDERRLHHTFRDLQYRSEWFFCQDKLRDLIFYLEGDLLIGGNRFVSRDQFECGICDCVLGEIGPWTIAETTDPAPWLHLAEETIQ